jgi:hypothetical protein
MFGRQGYYRRSFRKSKRGTGRFSEFSFALKVPINRKGCVSNFEWVAAAGMIPWKQLCSALQAEDSRRTETQIFIRLGNGLQISGLMDFEAAKSIFRDPRDITKTIDYPVGQQAVVILPPGTVLALAFPADPKRDN